MGAFWAAVRHGKTSDMRSLRNFFASAAFGWTIALSAASAQPMLNGHPDFSGLWQCRTNCGNGVLLPRETMDMTAEGQRLYAIKKAGVDRGDPTIDTGLMCHPLGIPRLAMFGTFDILQKDDHLAIVGEWLGPAREIYFQNEHRKDYFPTFMGDSIARWDGNTLVIDTSNIDEETLVDSSGFPHSDELHFIERWTLSPDGNTITSAWTLTDPKIFRATFMRTVTYTRKNSKDERQRIVENVCQNVEVGGKLR
jgi:hypothetical protein